MKGWGKDIGESFSLGAELALPTLLGALAGYYFDRHFSTAPIALIIGLVLGAALGLWDIVRRYLNDPPPEGKG